MYSHEPCVAELDGPKTPKMSSHDTGRAHLKGRMIMNQKHVTRRQIPVPRMCSVADRKLVFWYLRGII